MPTRPRQHALETESRTAFRSALPARWIVRDITPDYGLDHEVEVVASDDRVTGRQFLVQLKATDARISSESHCIRLDSETLDYYRSLDLPILLVFYHAPSAQLSARWVFDIPDLSPEERGATRSICFDQSHRWGSATADQLDRTIVAWRRLRSATLSLPLSVRLILPSGSGSIEWGAIEQAAQAFGLARLLSFTALPKADTIGEVLVSDQHLDIDLKIRPREHFATPNLGQPQTATVLVANAAVLVARELAVLGQARIAADIANLVAIQSTVIRLPNVAGVIAHASVAADRLNIMLKLVAWASDVDGLEGVATLFLAACALHADRLSAAEAAQLESVLASRVARALGRGDRISAGVDTYNLGRLIGFSGKRYLEAVIVYRRAFALAPHYRSRWYVWRELGALAFLNRRYRRAATCYERAVQLGGDSECHALLADALTWLGRYEEARAQYDAYLHHDGPEAHWELKAVAVKAIREWTGVASQRLDETAEAQSLEALRRGSENSPAAEAEFRNAIRAHGLCQVAWFNMGLVFLRQYGDHLNAAICFVICALYTPEPDTEAWANAILVLLNSGDSSLTNFLLKIVVVGYRQAGDSLYERVLGGFVGDDREKAEALVSQIFARVPPRVRRPELRLTERTASGEPVAEP